MSEFYRWLVTNPEQANALAAVMNVIVAAIATIIAVVSILFAWRSLSIQDKHNRLSVKPIPFAGLADYADHLRVKVTNDGVGPLIIKSVIVSNGHVTKDDVISWMPKLPKGIFWSTFTSHVKDRAFLSGTSLVLLELKGDESDAKFSQFREKCRTQLSSLTLTVEYTDIYETHYAPYSRNLNWFARDMGTSHPAEQK